MPRKNATTRIQALPPTAIPDAALISGLTLNATALELRDHLALTLERAEFTPLDSYTFCTRLLQAFCQDGSVSGVALHPPGSPLKKEKGQKRYMQPAALPARVGGDQPLLILVIQMLIDDGLRNQTPSPDIQFGIEQALAIFAQTLDALARRPGWKAVLLMPPDLRTHRVFELHYETFGYPAYPYFAASMHYGLIARIEEILSCQPCLSLPIPAYSCRSMPRSLVKAN